MMLRNFVIATLLAVSAATVSLPAQAQNMEAAKQPHQRQREHRKFDPAKAEEFHQKRIARMKEMLHITPAQESAWQTFVAKTKMTPPPKREGRKDMARLSEPERLEKMLVHFKAMEARMQEHLIAVKGLYAHLSPEQKTIFELMHQRHGFGPGQGHGRGHRRGGDGPAAMCAPGGPGGHGGGHAGMPPMEDDDGAMDDADEG